MRKKWKKFLKNINKIKKLIKKIIKNN
jgi:hypothetical protein